MAGHYRNNRQSERKCPVIDLLKSRRHFISAGIFSVGGTLIGSFNLPNVRLQETQTMCRILKVQTTMRARLKFAGITYLMFGNRGGALNGMSNFNLEETEDLNERQIVLQMVKNDTNDLLGLEVNTTLAHPLQIGAIMVNDIFVLGIGTAYSKSCLQELLTIKSDIEFLMKDMGACQSPG